MFKLRIIAVVLIMAGTFATSALAGLLTTTYNGFAHGSLSVKQTHNGNNRNALAGLFQFNVTDVSGVTAFDIQPGGKIEAFCVELSQNLKTTGEVQHQIVDGLTYFDNNQSLVDSISRLFTGFFANVTNAQYSAIFQIALWELITDGVPQDGNTNMTTNNYRVTNRVTERNIAATWLTQLDQFDNAFSVYILTNPGSQDLLIVNPLAKAVPAPASLALLLSAGFILFTMRRRGTAQTKAAHNPAE